MYKVTVEKLKPQNEDTRYLNYETVYEQKFNDIDIRKIIEAANHKDSVRENMSKE